MTRDTKRILIGASGSIGVLELHNYLLKFLSYSAKINLILTRTASKMVQQGSLRAIIGHEVFCDDSDGFLPVPHINLADWADFFVVLPASANIIAKAAAGIADDLLSTTIIARAAPIYFVPNMNEVMWKKPVVQRNVARIQEDGHQILLRSEQAILFEASSATQVPSMFMPDPQQIMRAIEGPTASAF
jgi:phosphopantothenoylcysteine synthetase/decarboxylase